LFQFREENLTQIWNNGTGIPVELHREENVYIIWSATNYDDNERKVTGGRNGYGAKLCYGSA